MADPVLSKEEELKKALRQAVAIILDHLPDMDPAMYNVVHIRDRAKEWYVLAGGKLAPPRKE